MAGGRSLGNTPSGSDWCLKALHPSDPIVEVRGIPDHSAIPSICMNYQTTVTLTPDPGFTGPWAFDMALLPHPINFGWIKTYAESDPTTCVLQTVLNSQLDAASHQEAYQSFSKQAERWRLAYASVTVYQDGADLTNQGTMVVAQVPSEPRYRAVHGPLDCLTADPGVLWTYPRLEIWDTDENCESSDVPRFDSSQGMPNAYFGRSREGAYVPLKLTQTCQDWTSAADEVYFTYALSRNPASQAIQIPTGPTTTDPDSHFPHFSDTAGSLAPACVDVKAGGGGYVVNGTPTSPMLSGNLAHICARNLALTTSYSFFFRFGIEMQVKPFSLLAPQMKLSPPYDPVALDAYFAIARELKDAYPADYNDLGKLWSVIKTAASYALPMLARAGPYGKLASTVGRLAITGGDTIQQVATNRRAGRSGAPSLAEIERLQTQTIEAYDQGKQVRAMRQARKKKKAGQKGRVAARV